MARIAGDPGVFAQGVEDTERFPIEEIEVRDDLVIVSLRGDPGAHPFGWETVNDVHTGQPF